MALLVYLLASLFSPKVSVSDLIQPIKASAHICSRRAVNTCGIMLLSTFLLRHVSDLGVIWSSELGYNLWESISEVARVGWPV